MPIPVTIGAPSATSSNINLCKKAMGIASVRNFAGVRCDAGINTFGSTLSPTFTHVTEAVNYAADAGLGKISFLLGYGPKITQTLADSFNGGALWEVRNRPPDGLWNWIADTLWQGIIDAATDAAVAKGKTPSTFLEFELFNEPGKGGVGGPHIGNLSARNYPAPYDALADGQIEAGFWTYAAHVASRVDFRGAKVIAVNFEGSSGTTGQTEMNSVSGSDAADLLALGDYVGTNCYAGVAGTPYNAATVKAAYSSKLNAQLSRMAANAAIGSKPKVLREFGHFAERTPRCVSPNTVRQDVLQQVLTESGIVHANFHTSIDPGTSAANSNVAAYKHDGTPLDSIAVSI